MRPPTIAVLGSIAALLLLPGSLPPAWSAESSWFEAQQLVLVTTPD
jgi:hypothetical protein